MRKVTLFVLVALLAVLALQGTGLAADNSGIRPMSLQASFVRSFPGWVMPFADNSGIRPS